MIITRQLFILFELLLPATGAILAQQPEWMPLFPETAASVEDYLPEGWYLIDSVSGMFDGDAVDDYVLYLERDEPTVMSFWDGDNLITDSAAPRVLLVLIGEPLGSFHLLAACKEFPWLDRTNPLFHTYLFINDYELEVAQESHGSFWLSNQSCHFHIADRECVMVRRETYHMEHMQPAMGYDREEVFISEKIEDYVRREVVESNREETLMECDECAPGENCQTAREDWTLKEGQCVRVVEDHCTDVLPDVPLVTLEEVDR